MGQKLALASCPDQAGIRIGPVGRRKKSDEGMTASRESMEFDVVIVGAGPAGLAAAVRSNSVIH